MHDESLPGIIERIETLADIEVKSRGMSDVMPDVQEEFKELGDAMECVLNLAETKAMIALGAAEGADAAYAEVIRRPATAAAREEAIDLAIAAIGLYFALGGNDAEFIPLLDRKVYKWEQN